jgi:hypothetical protein
MLFLAFSFVAQRTISQGLYHARNSFSLLTRSSCFAASSKRSEVYKLVAPEQAWNMDGSSSHKPPKGSPSWIGHWQKETGETKNICSYADCINPATVGGHVCTIKLGVCIVPICRQCNHPGNTKRYQSEKGNHSLLREGTTVYPITPTVDMECATRRKRKD